MNRTSTFSKYVKKVLILLSFLLCTNISSSQCITTIVAVRDTIACGEDLLLSNVGVGGASSDDFSGGTLSGLWASVTQGWSLTSPCGTSPIGGQHLWFASGSATPRTATTVGVDASCGGNICFDFRMETQSPPPCDGPDLALEGVYLQYLPPGGAGGWQTINYFSPIGFAYTGWQNHCFPIPAGAQFNGTQFRWTQTNTSGPTWDQWGIDNVNIATCAGYSNLWSGPGIPPGYTLDSVIVSPTSGPVDYHLIYSNWLNDTCYDTLSVYVEQPTIVSSLLSSNCSGSDTLDAQATIPANCSYRFQLWNYLPNNPSGMHPGWTTGQPPPGNYHYLNIDKNGSFYTSYTMQTGGSTTSQDFYLPVTDGDVVEATFMNLGTGANECAFMVYNSLNVPIATSGFPGSVPSPLLVSSGNEINVSCPATATYNYSWSNLTSGGTIGLSNPNIQNPLITVTVATDFQVIAYDSLNPGCTVTDTVSVMPNANPISVTMNTNPVICNGDDIILNFALLGVAPFDLLLDVNSTQITYQLDALGNNIITGGPIIFTSVTANTTFSILSLTDSTGCPGSITNPIISVTVNNPPNAGNGPGNTIIYCETDPPSDLFLHLTGSPDPGGTWTYSGTGPAPPNMPFVGTNYNFDPSSMPAGDYIYTVDNLPCPSDMTTVTISLETPPYAGQLPIPPTDMCVGSNLDLNTLFLALPVPFNPNWTDITMGVPGTNVSNSFNPFSSGTYMFRNTISSTANCPADNEDVTVIVHDLPTISISSTNQICLGMSVDLNFILTGSAPFNVTITDGTSPPVIVSLDASGNDFFTGNPISFTPASVGPITYTVTNISDVFCASSVSNQSTTINVLAPPNSGVVIAPLDVCSDDLNFYDLANQLLGQDLTGYWTDANGFQQPPNPSFNFNASMPSGNYVYTVTSVLCPDASTVLPVTVIPVPDPGIGNPQSICFNDYSATNPYDLTNLLSGFPDPGMWLVGSVPIPTNIDPNTYGTGTTTFTYQVNGIPPCSNQTIDVDLTINAEPIVNTFTSSSASTTQGFSVDLLIDMLSGTPPFTINIVDDLGSPSSIFISSGMTGQVTVLPNTIPVTTYNIVSITDGNGCTSTYNIPVNVSVIPYPVVNPFTTATPEICEGDLSTIEFDLIQGVTPVTIDYTINGIPYVAILNSNGINSFVIPSANLNVGINTFSVVSIMDVNGQSSPTTPNDIQIIVNPVPNVNFTTTTPVICFEEDAILEFDFMTGTAPFTVNYMVNTIPALLPLSFNTIGTQSQVISPSPNVGNNTYEVIDIIDDNGCIGTISSTVDILVHELPNLNVTISGQNPICFSDISSLSFPILSGLAPFNLNLLEGSTSTTLNIDASGLVGGQPYQVSPSNTTTYTLTYVTDANGCSSNLSDSKILVVNELPNVNVTGTSEICFGDVTHLYFDFTNGVSPWTLNYDINSNPPTNLTLSSSFDSLSISPTTTSLYNFTSITDGNNCSNTITDAITISVNQLPEGTISGGGEICDDGSTVDVIFNTSNGTPTFDLIYSVGISQKTVSNLGYQYILTTNESGTYTINSIIDAKGCEANNISGTVEVIVNPMPIVSFGAYPQPADITNPVINFVDQSTGHTTGVWDFDDNNTTLTNFGKITHRFSDQDSGTYYVELYIETDKGCAASEIKKIVIDQAFMIYIPNAFTPNNDQRNDFFKPVVNGVSEYEFYIYSRTGQRIFYTDALDEGWNGKIDNEKEYALSGKYGYAIYIVDIHGKKRNFHGDLLLIR